jgi:acetamidase/formamidase
VTKFLTKLPSIPTAHITSRYLDFVSIIELVCLGVVVPDMLVLGCNSSRPANSTKHSKSVSMYQMTIRLCFDAEQFKEFHKINHLLELWQVHNLSGPIRVTDTSGLPAMPGDLLMVEICNLGPLPGDEWGFTGIFDRENGGGFLTDHFPAASKAIWHFDGIFASSRHIPGTSFA